MTDRFHFAVSACTTYPRSFASDLDTYARAGVSGIGLWESKLPVGDDAASVELLRASGLRASYCFPAVPSVIPGDTLFAEPRDPALRADLLCAGIRRLAAFDPAAVICYAGPPGDLGAVAADRLVRESLHRAADTAGESGVKLALEVLRPSRGGSLAASIGQAVDLLDRARASTVDILIDAWHVEELDTYVREIGRYAGRIIGLQVCDRPARPRSWMDRVLPGDGTIDLVTLVAALERTGFDGWYELEIMSDDGTFGADYPDSLWKADPVTLLENAEAAFARIWHEARSSV